MAFSPGGMTVPGRVPDVGYLDEPTRLDIHAGARRAGASRWLDARLFEIVGGWVASEPEPEVKITFANHASHFGWHASLWGERLPSLHDVDPASWVHPGEGVEPAVTRLAEAVGTVERLVGVYRVLLPRLAAAHAEHLGAASAVTDGPTIRTLRLVLGDELEDQRAGERLLHTLLRTPPEVDRAAAHQAAVESLLAGAGPLLG